MTLAALRNAQFSLFAIIWALLLLISFVSLPGNSLAADFVRVKAERANIRKGPGTRFQKIWTAPTNYPYRVLKRNGKWLNVKDYQGYEEWIYAPLTDKKAAVIVRTKRANIRGGPGTGHNIRFTADRGVAFRVLKRQGNWLKVRHHDGQEGWIYRNLVWGPS